jgi:hypothetical protein
MPHFKKTPIANPSIFINCPKLSDVLSLFKSYIIFTASPCQEIVDFALQYSFTSIVS